MRTFTSVLFILLLAISAENMRGNGLQQTEQDNASPKSQAEPAPSSPPSARKASWPCGAPARFSSVRTSLAGNDAIGYGPLLNRS